MGLTCNYRSLHIVTFFHFLRPCLEERQLYFCASWLMRQLLVGISESIGYFGRLFQRAMCICIGYILILYYNTAYRYMHIYLNYFLWVHIMHEPYFWQTWICSCAPHSKTELNTKFKYLRSRANQISGSHLQCISMRSLPQIHVYMWNIAEFWRILDFECENKIHIFLIIFFKNLNKPTLQLWIYMYRLILLL